jgi:hypothetical protein
MSRLLPALLPPLLDLGSVLAGSYLERELNYLVNEKGYQWVNQWALKPGA